jgi:hypothetical protein
LRPVSFARYKVRRVDGLRRIARHADADRDLDLLVARAEAVILDGLPHALSRAPPLVVRRVGKDGDELLAAVAPDGIHRAQRLPHDARDVTQDQVARWVPVLVVDAFEMVDVDHEHGKPLLIASHALELIGDQGHRVLVVVQLGETVADREVLDPIEEPAVLHDDLRLVRHLGQKGIGLRAGAPHRLAAQGEKAAQAVGRRDRERAKSAERRLRSDRGVDRRRTEKAGLDLGRRGTAPLLGDGLHEPGLVLFHDLR